VLERGVLDGVSGFDFISAVAYKLHEIAPYFTNIGDGAHAGCAVGINLRVWNAFPDSIKQICNALVEEIYAGKFSEIYSAAAQRNVKTVLDAGGKFASLPDAEIARARPGAAGADAAVAGQCGQTGGHRRCAHAGAGGPGDCQTRSAGQPETPP